MKFKDSTIGLSDIKAQLVLVMIIIDQVMREQGQELVVTSLNDSRHSKTSSHYRGMAFDARSRFFSEPEMIAGLCREALGNNADVDIIVERDHFHIQYLPKRIGQ